jgi:ABC-type glycerol-3-phosphate transport system substrate-binding protein
MVDSPAVRTAEPTLDSCELRRPIVKVRFFCLCLAAALLIACGPQPEPPATEVELRASPTALAGAGSTPSPSPAPTRVSIWLSWTSAELAALAPLIDVYRQEHPGVEFALAFYPPDELLQAYRDHPAGADPAILIGPSHWGLDLWQEGAIQDLRTQISPTVWSRLYPLSEASVEYGGTRFGIPLRLNGDVLFRNAQRADTPAETVTAWIAAIRRSSVGAQEGAALDLGFHISAPFMAACGGQVVGGLQGLSVDPAAGVCWMVLLQNLGRWTLVVMNSDQDRELFHSQLATWIVEEAANAQAMREALPANSVSVDDWPIYPPTGLRLAGFTWSEAGFVSAGLSPERVEQAASFLSFLAGREAQSALAQAAGVFWLPVDTGAVPADPLAVSALRAVLAGMPRPMVSGEPPEIHLLEQAVRASAIQGTGPNLAWQSLEDAWTGGWIESEGG